MSGRDAKICRYIAARANGGKGSPIGVVKAWWARLSAADKAASRAVVERAQSHEENRRVRYDWSEFVK